jgi:hypothetical protein
VIVVIGPKFFGYAKALAQELGGIFYSELFTESHPIKVLIRLRLGYLFFYARNRYYKNLINEFKKHKVERVVFVDIEFVPLWFLKYLEKSSIDFRIYFWDSLRNKPVFGIYLESYCSRCSTFDIEDSRELNIPLINLFAEEVFFDKVEQRKEGLVFFGTVHSIRPRIIKSILEAGLPLDLDSSHMYYYNRWLAILRSLVDPNFRFLFKRNLVKYYPISKEEINLRMNKFTWVLDICHNDQSGLTSRSFEALCAGSKLLTNNTLAKDVLPSFAGSICTYKTTTNFSNLELSNFPPPKSDASVLRLNFFANRILSLFERNI